MTCVTLFDSLTRWYQSYWNQWSAPQYWWWRVWRYLTGGISRIEINGQPLSIGDDVCDVICQVVSVVLKSMVSPSVLVMTCVTLFDRWYQSYWNQWSAPQYWWWHVWRYLTGGISRIEINGQPLSIGDAALSLKGIVDYPVCAARPCQNGGTCRPASSEFGYQCFCRSGYSGQRCELIGERCFEGELLVYDLHLVRNAATTMKYFGCVVVYMLSRGSCFYCTLNKFDENWKIVTIKVVPCHVLR